MPGERIIVADRSALALRAAEWIAAAMADAIREGNRCALALTGGETARPCYERLAERSDVSHLWNGTTVFFGDERAVLPDHPDSNYGMARDSLLDRLPVPPAQIHRMEAERPDLDAAAEDYEASLPERFDLLLLGMGEDGHTASLFPGDWTVNETRRRVVPAFGGRPLCWRLTITPPVIHAARRILIMVAGREKADAVAAVLEGPDDLTRWPAQLARPGTWILDRAAARSLRRL
ncbi:MAG: 6-phosphogluconolactonase [Gemmatimonadales bacterium]